MSRLGTGGRIDRSRPISFTFNGKRFSGYAGDTLASALLANDVRIVATSVTQHRPRGIFSAGIEEPNALVQAGHEPMVRATQVAIFSLVQDDRLSWYVWRQDGAHQSGRCEATS